MKRIPLLGIAVLITITFSCGAFGPSISIISGSENRTLEPLLEEFTQQTGINVEMHYKGSLDIMLMLEEGNLEYDAVWPANSIWLHMGDKNRRVKHAKSIMNSPVIFGVRQSLARETGVFRPGSGQDRRYPGATLRQNDRLKFHDDQRHAVQLRGQRLHGIPFRPERSGKEPYNREDLYS
jgi:hypothetical protein